MTTRRHVLSLSLWACASADAPVEDAELKTICGEVTGSCMEIVLVDLTTRLGRSCEQDVGPEERCVTGMGIVLSLDMVEGQSQGGGGCRFQFNVDERIVPTAALVPNRSGPTSGLHVRMTEEHYEVTVEGISGLDVDGCEGTQAGALLAEGRIDAVTYTIDVEPNGRVFYHRHRAIGLAMVGSLRDEKDEFGRYPFYDGRLELQSGDVVVDLAIQVIWYPGGGPANLSERSDDELIWDVLTTGWAQTWVEH